MKTFFFFDILEDVWKRWIKADISFMATLPKAMCLLLSRLGKLVKNFKLLTSTI